MAYLHEVIASMKAHGCVSFTLDSKRGLIFQRPDGEDSPTGLRFTAGQVGKVLSEVAPPQDHVHADSYVFEERVDGVYYEVVVTHDDGTPKLRVSTIGRVDALAAPPPAPRPTPFEVPERGAVTAPPALPAGGPPLEPMSSLYQLLNRPLSASLKISERAERIFVGVLGVSLGLGLAAMLAVETAPGSVFSQMFDPHAPTSAVPALICCFFCWASLICIARWRRVRELERFSPTPLVVEIAQVVERSGPTAATKVIERSAAATATPLLRRCAAVLRQWVARPGLQNADIILSQHVAHDEEAVNRGYNLVRTFVWALPVLGLIGTVIGIALAVGGFASFLGGSIDDVRVVKQNLVGVTGGLSFAFLITLQGLLTSLVVMLVSSGLQTREERLYGRIQHDIVESLLPVLQKAAPDNGQDAAAAATHASAPSVVEAIEAAARAAIDARERERREEIVVFTRAVADATKEVAAQGAHIRDNAKALGGLIDATKSALAHQATLQTSVRAAAESLTEMSSAVSALQLGTTSLRESVLQVSAVLNQFDARSMSQAFSSMRTSLEQLAPILQSFRGPFVFQAVPVETDRRMDGQGRSHG